LEAASTAGLETGATICEQASQSFGQNDCCPDSWLQGRATAFHFWFKVADFWLNVAHFELESRQNQGFKVTVWLTGQ
jgi:hypothetical protein